MRIAAIAVSFNEDHQLAAFRAHLEGYRDQLTSHIIVDNGSRPDYVARLRQSFPSSVIVQRPTNGGTTAAFNEGIRRALSDPRIDAVLLTVQDVQLDRRFLPETSALLASDSSIAAAGGVVYSAGTAATVESYGGAVDWSRFELRPHWSGAQDGGGLPETLEVDFTPGGVTLFRREAFERVGLQDENLFMYCDELDWIYRAKQLGYRVAVTVRAKAWHQHAATGDPRMRTLRATFYTLRNQVYLIGKHHGRWPMVRRCAAAMLSALSHPGAGLSVTTARVAGPAYGALGLMGRRLYST